MSTLQGNDICEEVRTYLVLRGKLVTINRVVMLTKTVIIPADLNTKHWSYSASYA